MQNKQQKTKYIPLVCSKIACIIQEYQFTKNTVVFLIQIHVFFFSLNSYAQHTVEPEFAVAVGYTKVNNELFKQQQLQSQYLTKSILIGLNKNKIHLSLLYTHANQSNAITINQYQTQFGYFFIKNSSIQLTVKTGLGLTNYEEVFAQQAPSVLLPAAISSGVSNVLIIENNNAFVPVVFELRQVLGNGSFQLSYQLNYQFSIAATNWLAYAAQNVNSYANNFYQYGAAIGLHYLFL